MDWGEEHVAAWNERDPERLVARFAPAGRYVDMAYGVTFERHKVDGVSVGTFDDAGRIVETREYFNAGAFPAPDTTNERRMVDQ
jgi:hypothetical protein